MYRASLVSVVILLMSLSGCAISNHYEGYKGKVVDKETREPIVGAAVLAVYYTQSYTLAGSNLEYLDAQETVTDENGEFEIPPLDVATFRFLQSFEPKAWFIIFKPSYGCYPRHRGTEPMFLPNGTLPPNEDVVIELPKITSPEERRDNYSCYASPNVPRKDYPVLYNLIQSERINLGLKPIILTK